MANSRAQTDWRGRSIEFSAWIVISFYAALCGGVLWLAAKSKSQQIAAAAQLLAAGWIGSLAVWRWAESYLTVGLAMIDALLAGVFFAMSRGRWFPAPLFFARRARSLRALCAHNRRAEFLGGGVLNRGFELALGYVAACAVFRIARRGAHGKTAP